MAVGANLKGFRKPFRFHRKYYHNYSSKEDIDMKDLRRMKTFIVLAVTCMVGIASGALAEEITIVGTGKRLGNS